MAEAVQTCRAANQYVAEPMADILQVLEYHWVITASFFFVAVVTGKDLAAYAFMSALICSLVLTHTKWPAEYVIACIACVNAGQAVFSSYHYIAYKHSLGLIATILSAVAVINNAVQIVTYSYAGVIVSEILAWALIVALLVMPGRKGWVQDVFSVDGATDNSRVYSDSNTRNDKGDQ